MLELLLSSIVSLIGNAILFGGIPVIWWAAFHRKKVSLAGFTGLYKPERKAAWWLIGVFAVVYVLNYNFGEEIIELFLSEETIAFLNEEGGGQASELLGTGLIGLLPAMITTFISNGFFEEFFYRGFVLKRFKKLTDSGVMATMITAILFGLMHNAFYLIAGLPVGLDYHIGIFVYTTIGALLLGWANEKLFNGSIWPSVILHGAGNFISTLYILFAVV